MIASKIVHKNESRIKVEFPFNHAIASKLRQIPDTRWSKTRKAWHIPYTKEVYDQLLNLFPEVEISCTETRLFASPHALEKVKEIIAHQPENPLPIGRNEIMIEITGKKPFVENA